LSPKSSKLRYSDTSSTRASIQQKLGISWWFGLATQQKTNCVRFLLSEYLNIIADGQTANKISKELRLEVKLNSMKV